MILRVDVDVDLENAADRAMFSWFQDAENAGLHRLAVALGYHAVTAGVRSYCDQVASRGRDDALLEKCADLESQLLRERARALELERESVRAISEIGAAVQAEAARQADGALHDLREQLRTVREDFARQLEARDRVVSLLEADVEGRRAAARAEAEQQFSERMAALRAEHSRDLLEAKLESVSELARLRALYEHSLEQLDAAEPFQRVIRGLREELAEKQRTIDVMSRTNAARGNVGEDEVARALAAAFPSAAVSDASRVKQACDLHVAFPDGRVLAVEVKNKGTVTPGDVDKFVRDLRALKVSKPGFAGGVFVSVGCAGIPGKGELFCEMVDGLPATYVGFADGLDAGLLGRLVRLHMHVHEICAGLDRRATVASDLLDRVKVLFATVQRLRERADKVRAACAAAVEGTDAMKREIDAMFVGMHEVLATQAGGVEAPEARCDACGKTFTAKGLKAHARWCSGRGLRPLQPPCDTSSGCEEK